MVGNFSYLNQIKLSLHTLYVGTTMGRVGNRYVWQGGQSENHGGQTKNFSIKQMSAHPGLKPCDRVGAPDDDYTLTLARSVNSNLYM